ncbi:MAG: hypothetical protein IT423_10940 [Pirellulaceae bacterium]|nr:hypothetical protein [Pirellulaceae bacterium]
MRRTAYNATQQTNMYSDPLAYFITWTCYGTWLPGDDRSWTKWQKGQKIPQPLLADWCKEQMTEEPIVLTVQQRTIVEETIAKHCEIRGWHAVNCRSNHCHVVVTASSHNGEQVRDQLKAWCTRKLKKAEDSMKAEGRKPSGGTVPDTTPEGSRPAAKIEAEGRQPSGATARENWWTRKGSVRYLFDNESLEAAIQYTLEAQDVGGSKFVG